MAASYVGGANEQDKKLCFPNCTLKRSVPVMAGMDAFVSTERDVEVTFQRAQTRAEIREHTSVGPRVGDKSPHASVLAGRPGLAGVIIAEAWD